MEWWGHSTLHNIHMDTNMDTDTECGVYMGCGKAPHSIISIWIQTWIWIWNIEIHGVRRHFTFHNIHMDMDMAPCLHIITVTYLRYQNRPIQNGYRIIYHKFKDSKYTHPVLPRNGPFKISILS